MANLDSVLRQLREEHKQAQSEAQQLEKAILTIEGLSERSTGTTSSSAQAKRTISAAGRKRIAEARRARWSKLRKGQPSTRAAASAPRRSVTRSLSPEGRKRIAAATPVRWARVKSQQGKKAA